MEGETEQDFRFKLAVWNSVEIQGCRYPRRHLTNFIRHRRYQAPDARASACSRCVRASMNSSRSPSRTLSRL